MKLTANCIIVIARPDSDDSSHAAAKHSSTMGAVYTSVSVKQMRCAERMGSELSRAHLRSTAIRSGEPVTNGEESTVLVAHCGSISHMIHAIWSYTEAKPTVGSLRQDRMHSGELQFAWTRSGAGHSIVGGRNQVTIARMSESAHVGMSGAHSGAYPYAL